LTTLDTMQSFDAPKCELKQSNGFDNPVCCQLTIRFIWFQIKPLQERIKKRSQLNGN